MKENIFFNNLLLLEKKLFFYIIDYTFEDVKMTEEFQNLGNITESLTTILKRYNQDYQKDPTV